MDEILSNLKTKIETIRNDSKLMSGIYILTLISALLVLAIVVKGPEISGKLIVNDSGNVVGIQRSSLSKSERYELEVIVNDVAGAIERNVSLTLQASEDGKRKVLISEEDTRESEIEAGLDALISEVEYSKAKKVMLPRSLPDGTGLSWSSREDRSQNKTLLTIIVVYVCLIGTVIASSFKPDKGEEDARRSIMKGLPRFCNQLFLMMNAGLILSDAFDTITSSYGSCSEESLSPFEKELAELKDSTDGHRISTASVLNEYALKHDVKEMIRIASILNENEKRGSDVVDSLARESRYLWDERKIVARESGKMIDSKMSYPLGLLLIVLIVITMAPALLSM